MSVGVRCHRLWHGVPHNDFLAEEVGALISHEQGVDRLEEQHVYVAREVCERNVLSEESRNPDKVEVTSVEEGRDVQVTMSAMVQFAREIDESAPHVMFTTALWCPTR